MAGGAALLCALLCALLLLAHTGTGADVTVQSNSSSDFLLGNNISLFISYAATSDAIINWLKDGFLLVSLQKNIITVSPLFQSRLDIIGNGSQLVITNSTKNDSGIYTVNVMSFSVSINTRTFLVKIYDPVRNPLVLQSPATADESTPVVNLSCSAVSGGENYTWTREGKSLPSNISSVTLDNGRTLQITAPNRTLNGNYTCNVSNPVDWKTATWTLNISYSDSPSPLSAGAIAGIVIGSVVGALLLIALIVIVILCIRKRRKGKKEKNPGDLHKDALRTISGATLSPDDPAYFTMNNIMYRNSSISMGSYIMNSGDNTSEYFRNPSPKPPPSEPKVKHATQV